MSGCVTVRVSGCITVRVSGCVTVRVLGCVTVRMSGCVTVRVPGHDHCQSVRVWSFSGHDNLSVVIRATTYKHASVLFFLFSSVHCCTTLSSVAALTSCSGHHSHDADVVSPILAIDGSYG